MSNQKQHVNSVVIDYVAEFARKFQKQRLRQFEAEHACALFDSGVEHIAHWFVCLSYV
jgi:hypothetical protein